MTYEWYRMVGICAFIHCSNSTYSLSRWSRLTCLKDRCKRTDDTCQCPLPFTLLFPTERRDLAARLNWAKAVYRKRTNGKTWLPSADDRICSIHFIHGKPTAAQPNPTQNLGVNVASQFSQKPLKLRQEPAQHNIDPSKLVEDVYPMPGNDQQLQHNDHSYVYTCNCSPACQCVCCNSQPAKLKNLQNEYDEFKEIVIKSKTTIFTYKKQTNLIRRFLADDKKLRTHTRLPNISAPQFRCTQGTDNGLLGRMW